MACRKIDHLVEFSSMNFPYIDANVAQDFTLSVFFMTYPKLSIDYELSVNNTMLFRYVPVVCFPVFYLIIQIVHRYP